MQIEMTSGHTLSNWCSRIPFTPVGILFLAAITLILHKSALNGFWRFDDGAHLGYVTTYSPWQYFFNPEITRLQSGTNLTPWNAFFYDINLWLFGFNPKGFYACQLATLWLTSVATFFFLRLWIAQGWALFGALLFLSGAPTVHIANELMTGQYAAGLLFSVVALHAYVLAVREEKWLWSLIGASFYLLATTCKEVYVPLVGVLLFLPTGILKKRIQFSLPFTLIALAYIPWRYAVLGRLFGGYKPDAGYNPLLIAKTFGNLPVFLFGSNDSGKLALFIIVALIIYALYRRKGSLKLLITASSLLLLPLIPLTVFPGITAPDRYLYFIWWGGVVFIAYLLSISLNNPGKLLFLILSLVLLGASLKNAREVQHELLDFSIQYEKSYQFVLNSNINQAYVTPSFDSYYVTVLSGIIAAEKAFLPTAPQRAKIVLDEEQLATLDLTKTSVWSYSEACHCIENIASSIPKTINEYQKKLVEKPLSVKLHFEKNWISWEFGPYKSNYEFVLVSDNEKFEIDSKGISPFGKNKSIDFYLRYKSPEGWIVHRSPLLHFEPIVNTELTWSKGIFVSSTEVIQFSSRSEIGGQCSIDILAGSNSQSVEVSARKPGEIQGWALLPDQDNPPQEVAMELKSSSGATFYAILPRSSRPDVAKHFGRSSWENSGFRMKDADFSHVPAGTYLVSVLQRHQDIIWRCATPKQLTIHP